MDPSSDPVKRLVHVHKVCMKVVEKPTCHNKPDDGPPRSYASRATVRGSTSHGKLSFDHNSSNNLFLSNATSQQSPHQIPSNSARSPTSTPRQHQSPPHRHDGPSARTPRHAQGIHQGRPPIHHALLETCVSSPSIPSRQPTIQASSILTGSVCSRQERVPPYLAGCGYGFPDHGRDWICGQAEYVASDRPCLPFLSSRYATRYSIREGV